MTKTTRARTKAAAVAVPVPQSDGDAAAAVAQIGGLMRRLASIQSYADERIAEIQSEVAQEIAGPKAELDALRQGLQVWCEANRDRLTSSGRTKTVTFPTGVVSWRHRPPKVTFSVKVDAVVNRIRSLGLTQFFRTKVEINKEAMLAHPELARQISGVTIGSAGEDFVVEPTGTETGVGS